MSTGEENENSYSFAQNTWRQDLATVPNPDKMNFYLFWLYSRGEYEDCLRVLESWQNASCTNYPFALSIKGMINRHYGKINESLKFFKLCHVIDEHNPKFLKQVAKTLRLTGRFKTALQQIESAEQIDPSDWEVIYIKAHIYENLNQIDNAKKCLEQALSYGTENKKILIKLGQLYMLEGQNEQAQQLLDNMADKYLFDNEILAEFGSLSLKMGHKPVALHSFGQAFALDQKNTNVLIGKLYIVNENRTGIFVPRFQ